MAQKSDAKRADTFGVRLHHRKLFGFRKFLLVMKVAAGGRESADLAFSKRGEGSIA